MVCDGLGQALAIPHILGVFSPGLAEGQQQEPWVVDCQRLLDGDEGSRGDWKGKAGVRRLGGVALEIVRF